MKNILFIPIDNRPITYSLTKQISQVNKSLNLKLPERNLLGGLVESADIEGILDWLKLETKADLIILSLDTLCYGGLVSSRRCLESFFELKKRVDTLKEILIYKKNRNKNLKIYATSSIMRISNNNVNEEEKEYWNLYGEKIFKYSYEKHKNKTAKTDVPQEILDDYLQTRKRNFDINKLYLEFLKENVFDFLIYSKDDTGKFGLNVEEACFLEKEIKNLNLPAIVKTGADEIPLGLLLRGVVENLPLKFKIVYSNPKTVDKISRYEDLSVKNCVEEQIKIGVQNSIITDKNEDIILFVNNFREKQGDLVFQDVINSSPKAVIDFKKPFIIADINNANGADIGLVENMLKGFSPEIMAYSGYNTSANTIGSALCLGVISYLAKKDDVFDAEAFKKVMFIRLMDDWGYQANVRKKIQGTKNCIFELEKNLLDFKPFQDRIEKFLNKKFEVSYSLPWKRSFEIEIEVE